MSAEHTKKKWSLISPETMRVYLAEAGKLLVCAQENKVHPFAAGLAGVMFIRNALALMGGEVAWWQKLCDPATSVDEVIGPVEIPKL